MPARYPIGDFWATPLRVTLPLNCNSVGRIDKVLGDPSAGSRHADARGPSRDSQPIRG